RTEGDGNVVMPRKLEQFRAGINFAAILAQAGGVQFDGTTRSGSGGDELFVQRTAILFRTGAEFFWQVRVADDFEQPGFGRLGKTLEVNGPDFKRIAFFPFRELGGVVDVPRVRDIMHGTDEIIPRVPRRQFANPLFLAWQ